MNGRIGLQVVATQLKGAVFLVKFVPLQKLGEMRRVLVEVVGSSKSVVSIKKKKMRLPTVKIFHLANDTYFREWAVQSAEILVGFGYTVDVVPTTFCGCKTFRPDENIEYLQEDEAHGEKAISLCMTLWGMYRVRLENSITVDAEVIT